VKPLDAIRLIVSLGVATVWGGVKWWLSTRPERLRRRRIAQAGTTLVDGAVVTLTGEVRALERTLAAPLTYAACVAFDVRGYSIELSDLAVRDCRGVAFVLDTGAAQVIVDEATPDIELPGKPLLRRDMVGLRSFCERKGIEQDVSQWAFVELAIVPGSRIAVHGRVVAEPDPTASTGYRDTSLRFRVVALGFERLTITSPRGAH